MTVPATPKPTPKPTAYEDFEHLAFSRPSPGVVLVTINRPERLNAADMVLHQELSAVWRVIDDDASARASVITGAGRAFSAGGDLEMIRAMTEDHATLVTVAEDAAALVQQMVDSRKPIVSAVNGVAVGAGLAVALLADVSVVGEGSRLSDGHNRLGVAAGDHAVLVWPLLCGLAKAKYYLMTADFVSGPEAERIGLVTKCVADADVLSEALAIAARLAAGSATGVQWTKRALNSWLRQALPSFGESLALEMLGFLGPDAAEGLAAVTERRQPAFPSAQLPEPEPG
jgi:enoyl-CoA hydratase